MRIKKLMIKGFGALQNREYLFDPYWTEIPFMEGEEEDNINTLIMALLFGFPPHQQDIRQRFAPMAEPHDYSAAMIIETADGEFLIGRNFTQETLEVFKLEAKRLFAISPLALMDLLFKEIGLLNPLDFNVIAFFQSHNLTVDQNAPLVREHIQRLVLNDGLEEMLLGPEREAKVRQIQEELAAIEKLQTKLDRWQAKIRDLMAEEKRYASYEKFLSSAGEDLLALTGREYTAAALESSFYEEQLREEEQTRAILEKEVASLRQKIASFDSSFYTVEREQQVNRLLQQRKELNKLLQQEEEALIRLGQKGFWSRIGGREQETEIKLRIEAILQKLARIRGEFQRLLNKKKPEDFLNEKALLAQYQNDLARLERPSLLKNNDGQVMSEYERAREKAENLRREREKLLALTGQETLETVQAKVHALSTLRQQRRKLEEELAVFLNELGEESPEGALHYLRTEQQNREADLKAEKESVVPVEGERATLLMLYRNAGQLLSILTEGEYEGLLPLVNKNILGFKVRTAAGWRPTAEENSLQPRFVMLAFRLALAKAQWRTGQSLLLFDDLFSELTPHTESVLRTLLTEWFPGGQIIIRRK